MYWKITQTSRPVEYHQGDNSFFTDEIKLESENFHLEPSAGHQEPEEKVCVATYAAKSTHGKFAWRVTARQTGFETYAIIEDVLLIESPDQVKIADLPTFSIEQE